MKLAICTIQRNRGRWLKEWFAFHYLVGVRKFYFFAHKCTDNTAIEIAALQQHFDITAFKISDDAVTPQLAAYQYTYDNFNHEFDWIAFIDGDEFLFTPCGLDIRPIIERYAYSRLSALAVYWACFGSGGHVSEPLGLITENYRQRAPLDFVNNRHIKSLVQGRQPTSFRVVNNPHVFVTHHGTFDELFRPITTGITNNEPSHQLLRINHYTCQSVEFFLNFKQHSGAPDSNPNLVRTNHWWSEMDRNDEVDTSLESIMPELREILSSI